MSGDTRVSDGRFGSGTHIANVRPGHSHSVRPSSHDALLRGRDVEHFPSPAAQSHQARRAEAVKERLAGRIEERAKLAGDPEAMPPRFLAGGRVDKPKKKADEEVLPKVENASVQVKVSLVARARQAIFGRS